MPKAKLVTDINNTYFTNNKVTVGTSAPTTGTYVAGDMVISSSANATAFGWICTASGSPGSWKVLKSGVDVSSIAWDSISNKPATFTPTIGTTSTTAFRGDQGNVAYNHSQQAHAPSNAQRNADITKAEIEAKLIGSITTHNHDARYYTEEEVNSLLGGKANTDHKHGSDFYYKHEIDEWLANKAEKNHKHGSEFYYKYEIDEWLAGKSNTNHEHAYLPTSGGTMTGDIVIQKIRLNKTWGHENYIGNGNGDNATYDTHNMVIRSWWGIGFRDYDNVCRTVLDTRTGNLMTKGALYSSAYIGSGRIYIDDHCMKAYDSEKVSIIRPDGQEFSNLEVKHLLLGPYSGATRRLTMSSSAPSSPTTGDVWIQN